MNIVKPLGANLQFLSFLLYFLLTKHKHKLHGVAVAPETPEAPGSSLVQNINHFVRSHVLTTAKVKVKLKATFFFDMTRCSSEDFHRRY
jgi:hypothetical protein